MNRRVLLLLLNILVEIYCQCPEDDQNLIRWSDHAQAWENTVPGLDGNVTIDKGILFDEQPPPLWSIHVTSSGKLVWDPNTKVHLKVHWIQVDGEIHIGSEQCPYQQNTRITFLGNVEENNLGPGGDKALFVTSGGTLEIHGKPKVSWTKLAQTAPKYDEVADTVVEQVDLGPGNKLRGKGLIAYSINTVSGLVEAAEFFQTNIRDTNYPEMILKFLTFVSDIPNGNIVVIAVKKELVKNGDLNDLIEGIEILAGQTSGASPLRSDDSAVYVLVTVKGSPDKSVESYIKWNSVGMTIAETELEENQYLIRVRSESANGGKSGACRLLVAREDKMRPVLKLIEDVSTWESGDKVVIASTDFNWKQAEDMTLMKCDTCTADQIKLSAPLMHTHYGEIYKNIDMRGEIGLLTRNILFDSEDAEGSTTYGGNLKVLKGFKSVHIQHAEFNDLGQQEVLGRYPIHFHMCEDVDQDENTRPWIKHNSIHHSNSRCVTVHGTHGLIVEDNVCYMTRGHGYFLEDGGEKRTILDGNLGLGQEKGTLIKADSRPSTFWITNPLVHIRNNVAAGGEGRGYWFTYPRLPLPPSDDKGFMLKDEARHTAITEFYNNAAHSNRNHGFFIDNEFLPDTSAKGYNRYRPVADPIMHLMYKNSTDVPAIFDRMTAYKNSPRNAWFRGGMLKIVRASMSDSGAALMTITKENKAKQFVEKSVFIGESPNVGKTSIINGQPISIGRSLPLGSAAKADYKNGLSMRKGPIYMTDIFFDGFANNEYYKQGALGFSTKNKQSPLHSVTNALFGFSDPSEGNRVLVRPYEEEESIRDDERSFRDINYSVTGLDSNGGVVTVLNGFPLHLTSDGCKIRSNWNFAYCNHAYGSIDIMYQGGEDNVVTLTRDDDYLNARADEDRNNGASFLTIVGEDYGYSMYWEEEVPESIVVTGKAVSKSQNVRIGMCLPPNAEFSLTGKYPTVVGMNGWTRVNSLNEVTDKALYFYDDETGYLAFLLLGDAEFVPGHFGHCPVEGDKSGCPKTIVKVTGGDRTQTDCLEAAHDKLNLSSGSSSKRRLSRLLDILSARLMSNRLHKRAVEDDLIDTRVLDATASDPPATWGAGATK